MYDVEPENINVNIENSSELNNERSQISENENNISGSPEIETEFTPNNVVGSSSTPDTPWFRNPTYRKIGLFAIIGVVICAIIIGLAVGLSKKNKSKTPIEDENNKKLIIYSYNISTLYFNSTKEETIKTLLEDLNIDNGKNRRLKEISKTKTINTEYLFTIVSEPNKTVDYYTGYVLILSRNETLEGNDKNKYLDDSDNINNDKNYNGVLRVKFKVDGTILDLEAPKGLNVLYLNEINETINCLIPKKKDEKNDIISNNFDGGLSLNDSALSKSEYKENLKISKEDIYYKQGVFEKNILIQNGEYSDDNSNKEESSEEHEIGFDADLTINGLIESVDIKSIQTTKFKKDDGKELAEKYKIKLEQLEWSKVKTLSTNNLRVLSKEEYEENLKLQNKDEKNSNNLRDLAILGEITDSLAFPIAFKYELFKTNVLGLQLALRAAIRWVPAEGKIIFQLSYKRGTTIYYLDEKVVSVDNGNYGKLIVSYKTLTITIIKNLQDLILHKMGELNLELANKIKIYLNDYSNSLNGIVTPLTSLYTTYFKSSLNAFKENIFENAKSSFSNLYNDLNIISILENINNLLNNENETNLKNLISKVETALNKIIDTHKSNLTDLESKVENFITYSSDSIKALKDYQKVGIDFYYRVKEIFHKIDVMIDSFKDNLENALDTEFLLLQSYVNDDIYMGKIDALIDDVEVVWDIFKNNDILKETITNGNADIIVSKLENIRKKYEEMKNTFLDKVKNAYNRFKNNNIKNAHTEIQNIKQNLNSNGKSLIELIMGKVLYITNYEKYNEDIRKIINIENEISDIKLNAYQTFINNKLNEITSDLFLDSTKLNNIKKEIEEEVKRINENLMNDNVTKLKENFNNIISKFSQLSSSSNIENIRDNIKNRFSTQNLKTLVSNYYKYVNDNGITKYSTLVDEITKNSLDKYITEPVELLTKIKSMTSDTETNSENENEKLQDLVSIKMKNILNDVISKIRNLIQTEMNYVRANINQNYLKSSSEIIATGNFYDNSLDLIDDLDKKTSNYLSSLDYSLGLKSTFQQKEEEINSKISVVAENLKQNFYYLFCYENNTLNTSCPNAGINKMDEYDKYYFQVSKFRDALNHLTLLQPYINDVVNDENLKDLSADKFVNLYKNPENFDVNIIAAQVKKYLEILRKEGLENTKSNVNALKDIIKSSFTSGYNLNDVIFKEFFNKLFSIKDDNLEEDLDKLFLTIQRLARNGYTKDLKLYRGKKYYNPLDDNLQNEYNKTWEKYSNKLNEIKNSLSYNLKLTEELSKKINEKFEDKIFNDINNYRRELILNVTGSPKNCKLLDNEIALTDIVEEAIIELKNDISSNIKNDLLIQFKEALNDYNVVFYKYFNDFHDKIKEQYRYFFNSYHNTMSSYSNLNSTDKLTQLTEGILEGFEDGINLCSNELKLIFENNTLNISNNIDNTTEHLLNNIFKDISFKIPNTDKNIDVVINNLKLTCDKELIREKDSFKNDILEYIKLGFNNTITNFMKGTGKLYLDGIFLDDYDVNIKPKFDYIQIQCKIIDDYLYYIIEGLYDVDSYLTNSVKEVYYQLMNYINDGITLNEINAKLFKKIDDFKLDSAKKIVDYFTEYTLGILTSESFKNLFSIQVQGLLPNYVPYPLVLNFSNIIKEFLDSSYLSQLKQKYQINIINRRVNLVKEIEQLQISRSLHISQLGQGFSSSHLASAIVEYNKLNATISKLNYKFNFDFSNDKKTLADNILLNSSITYYLKKIPSDYNKTYKEVQDKIKNNVRLTLNLSEFEKSINDLKKKINSSKPYEEAQKIRTEFFNKFISLYDGFEDIVTKDYSEQVGIDTEILPIEKQLRRLDEKVDIEIESIQAIINLIDIQFFKLSQNISNSAGIVNITNELNQINNAIDVQLIMLDNTLESYLKYSKFYLKDENTLNNYQENITNIYEKVEKILTDFIGTQLNDINIILKSIYNYKVFYIDDVKPDIIDKINKVVKDTSIKFINNHLKNNGTEDRILFHYNKTTDLTNLGGVNEILGSTRLNYSFNIHNTVLEWGYKFKPDGNNAKVKLDVYAGGYSDLTISYGNDYYNTSIAGSLGKGIIGMNITNNFSNDRVYINYYRNFKNNTYTKTLYELTTLDSWGVCEDAVDCFVGINDDYCPYIVRVEDENKMIVKPESNDLGYYKNSSYYLFTGYYENRLCTFANYFYSAEETLYEFNAETHTTL